MLFRFVALVLISLISAAQMPCTAAQQESTSGSLAQEPGAPTSANAPASTGSIIVPQGSLVALKLISTIKSKSSHPGDPVRAVVAFPLAVDSRVAIPAGTYVDGVVNKVSAHASGRATATVQLRFNRLLFANGYSVPLVATNIQASFSVPTDPRRSTGVLADARDGAPYLGEAFAFPVQNPTQPPPLPPPPSVGPSPGVIAGIGAGVTIGVLVLSLAVSHHRIAGTDYTLFDSGWQFQMALQEPLTLDAAQVSSAAAMAR